MHLWPSSRIRDSFKIGYLNKLEWNLHRMKSEKGSQSNQKLLENETNGKGVSDSKTSRVLVLCGELVMMISCCYCCFCCGACVDEEEN